MLESGLVSITPFSSSYQELTVTDLDVFRIEDGKPKFEDFVQTNGSRFWYARDLMKWLG